MGWLSGFDWLSGAITWSTWAAGGAAALLAWIGVIAYRWVRQNQAGRGRRKLLVSVGLALVGLVIGGVVFQQFVVARRAVEARAAELRARAMAPGSVLACLNSLSNPTVEAACEAAVFASPETVASAMAYTDARLSLLADSVKYAAFDRGYQQTIEWLQLAVESDRFGIVAHVLSVRGCVSASCERLKLLRDPRRVLANLEARTFDALVAAHSVGWRLEPPNPANVAAPPPPPDAQVPMASAAPPLAIEIGPGKPPGGTTGSARPDQMRYPSPASIPPVSIMKPEPPLLPGAQLPTPPPTPAAAPSGDPEPPPGASTQIERPPSGAPAPPPGSPSRRPARESPQASRQAPRQPQAPPPPAPAPPAPVAPVVEAPQFETPLVAPQLSYPGDNVRDR